jgi:hypothetical protein
LGISFRRQVSSETASRLDFCSIADAKYLAQVVVMQRSLREALPGARSEVLCMDRQTRRVLEAMALPGLVPVAIEELESRDPELLAVREGRTPHEYAQTAKPAICLDLLRRREADWVTYVDADSMFFSDPGPVFEELGEASIGILGHRFAPRFRSRERWASPYIPSWVSFANDPRGVEVARWWRSRCIEWCFHRVEGERHSDQGYLRDWPRRFDGVHVLQHPGLGPAPWTHNDGLGREGATVTIDGQPLILFHYQSLRLQRARGITRGGRPVPDAPMSLFWRVYRGYRISDREQDLVWEPYLRRLGAALAEASAIEPGLVDDLQPPSPQQIGRDLVRHAWMRKHELAAALERRRGRVVEDGGPAPG